MLLNKKNFHSYKTILSIILFIVTYILILILVFSISLYIIYLGVIVFINLPKLYSIVLGLFISSIGTISFFLIIKYLVRLIDFEQSELIEINELQEPELIKLINELSNIIGTSQPNKVYLTADTSAGVSFENSFKNIFKPPKKNLYIGLGLINSLTIDELKAIISHELAHLSQEDLRVGIYVKLLRKLLIKLNYEKHIYEEFFKEWEDLSDTVDIFVLFCMMIISFVLAILNKLFDFVNINYMKLSKEMEYNADEIASAVVGNSPIETSLHKQTLSEHSLDSVFKYYEDRIDEKIKSNNVYKEQRYVMNFIADNYQIPINYNLPIISSEKYNEIHKSKLKIESKWDTHPSIENRVKKLRKGPGNKRKLNDTPANNILTDVLRTQKFYTKQFFRVIDSENEFKTQSFDSFTKDYTEKYEKNAYPSIYNNYYDKKAIYIFDLNQEESDKSSVKFDELFSSEIVDLINDTHILEQEIELIKMIKNNSLDQEDFIYDDTKYSKDEINNILPRLEKELIDNQELIVNNDIKIYHYFSTLESRLDTDKKLKTIYTELFEYYKDYTVKNNIYKKISINLEFLNERLREKKIIENLNQLRNIELKFKININSILNNTKFEKNINEEIRNNFDDYLYKKNNYFENGNYNEDSLILLFNVKNNFKYLIELLLIEHIRKLLDYQEFIYNEYDSNY